MTAIHVVVRPRTARTPSTDLQPLYGLFDVVVDGINVTARIGDAQALALLGDLGLAVADLASGTRSRTTVQLYTKEEAWELGLERDGDQALVSVYRAGPRSEIAVLERPVGLSALRRGVLEAIDSLAPGEMTEGLTETLTIAKNRLLGLTPSPAGAGGRRHTRAVQIAPPLIRGIGFRAEVTLRVPAKMVPCDEGVERADLHALLCKSTFGVMARSRSVQVVAAPAFLVAERLVDLCREALDAVQNARPLFRRCQVGPVRLGIRLGAPNSPLSFSLSAVDNSHGPGLTFPEIDCETFVHAVTTFAKSLSTAIIDNDPSQRRNLRLNELVSSADLLLERTHAKRTEDDLTNPDRERYQRFSGGLRPNGSDGRWSHGSAMRFLPRWTATVPNLDPESLFVCGDGFVVGSQSELSLLNRSSGEILWQRPAPRAGTLATPTGILRIHPDGRVSSHELETGSIRFSLRLVPRAFGGACGAVVHSPGLPKVVVIAEGDRRISAVDLVSGEIRWRYTAARPAPMRIRRAGKLIIVGGGDSVLVALDVATGETIWRVHDELPFNGDIIVDGDDVLAVTSAAQSRARIHRIDVWSGEIRWQGEITGRPQLGQAPLISTESVVVPLRDGRGTGAAAFDRETGELGWQLDPGVLPRCTGWLGLEETVIANGSDGTLTAIECRTGALRYRHVFSRSSEFDQPRRLAPSLRSGALFVPQSQVHVLRSTDGQLLGSVPSDLIADVLRVDDQCSVYMAEESGHLASFGVAPTLIRVK
jgi:outer membrane protein assembly factor BamB